MNHARYHSMFWAAIIFCLLNSWLYAQELNVHVRVIADQMPVQLNRKIFQQLEVDLASFLNTRRWTSDVYAQHEKIECTFALNLERYEGDNTYRASLTIQALRPVFNSLYLVSLLNLVDRDIVFRYRENQNIAFNDNHLQGVGVSALESNLASLFAFYAYTILGIHYSSFSLKSGYPYFQKAFGVVSNAPEGNGISGWAPYQSRRNRYWIADIFVNSLFNRIYDVYYTFYRLAMDNLYKKDKNVHKHIIDCLDILYELANQAQTNLSLFPIFIQGKREVLINVFRSASPKNKKDMLYFIEKIDPSHFIEYERALQ